MVAAVDLQAEVQGFRCPAPDCNGVYEEQSDAWDCCGVEVDNVKSEGRWSCQSCNEVYDTKKKAQDCCYEPYQQWLCALCSCGYDDKDDARDCCTSAIAVRVFRCQERNCGQVYDERFDAFVCHGGFETVMLYRCKNCGDTYEFYRDVKSCCQ